MTPMTLTLALLVAEGVLLLLALLTVSWFRDNAARRRDNQAIETLVARVNKSRAQRESVIEGFLAERMQMSGAALEQAKVAMLRGELALLQRFAGIYRRRDADAAARFDTELAAALGPYQQLEAYAEPLQGEHRAVDRAEIEALRADNLRLSEELTVTMETMSRMLNEYSTLFAGGVPGGSVSSPGPATGDAIGADGVPEVAAGEGAEEGLAEFLGVEAPESGDLDVEVASAEDPAAGVQVPKTQSGN
ncbi:MAG: hypothetical protein PVJ03_04305 [Chromatiaceae bacterium]